MSAAQYAHEKLTVEWRELQDSWRDARAAWKDGVAVRFERRFIEPLTSDIPPFLHALESLSVELRAARRELR